MAIKINTSPGLLNKRDIVIRHGIILLLAIFFGLLGKADAPLDVLLKKIVAVFFNIVLIWNGNLFLIELFDRKLSWETQLRHKIVLVLLIAICWPVVVHITYGFNVFSLVNEKPCDFSNKESNIYLVVSVVCALFVNSVFIGMAFFKFWRLSIKEKEELKRESISAEFATLKNQINPHFLFNSLNTLTNLIEENPKMATEFVQKMSSVYRYVLTQRDKETVTIREELPFIESYIYLNRIRFGNNLRTHIHIEQQHMDAKVATLALQMLIENAIKHNVISEQKPLTIYIGVFNGGIFVRNNLQRKSVMNDSNGIGLNNIVHRYSFLTTHPIDIIDDDKEFMVSLPLL